MLQSPKPKLFSFPHTLFFLLFIDTITYPVTEARDPRFILASSHLQHLITNTDISGLKIYIWKKVSRKGTVSFISTNYDTSHIWLIHKPRLTIHLCNVGELNFQLLQPNQSHPTLPPKWLNTNYTKTPQQIRILNTSQYST